MNIFRKIRWNLNGGIFGLLLLALPACQSGSQPSDSEIRIIPPSNSGPTFPYVPSLEEDSRQQAQEPPRSVTEVPASARRPTLSPAESLPESLPAGEEVSEAPASTSIAAPQRWKYKKYFFVIFDGM